MLTHDPRVAAAERVPLVLRVHHTHTHTHTERDTHTDTHRHTRSIKKYTPAAVGSRGRRATLGASCKRVSDDWSQVLRSQCLRTGEKKAEYNEMKRSFGSRERERERRVSLKTK